MGSDICFGFFNSVFPPYEIARRFCSDPDFALDVQLGNYFIEWEPFELSKEDYNEIKEYCMTKFKCHYFELETNINSSRDYIMWRIEKNMEYQFRYKKSFIKDMMLQTENSSYLKTIQMIIYLHGKI